MALSRQPIALLLPLAALLFVACDDPTPPAPGADAGTLPLDASVSTDAGEQPADAGNLPETDAGTLDAGTGTDAGIDDPCQPNPCADAEGHRTRCLWDGQGGFTCNCDVGFHGSDGLCCPPYSNNVGGSCQCNAGYHLVGDACVVECSEDSIEGFNGWCPEGELCVQGACVVDVCQGHTCPANSDCVIRANEPFCLCASGYHSSNGLCCPLDATNVDGSCVCDAGYVMQNGACVADPSNPCLPTNPCRTAGLHRNTCVQDSSAQGYRCDCNVGYQLQDGACVLAVWPSCPAGSTCRADVCVPHDLSQEQCLTDADCREFTPTAPTTCNAGAAGGICLNCTQPSDCPGNTQCTPYGTCALLCDSDADCFYGRCATASGYCVQSYCSSDADCGAGTVCINGGDGSQGMCRRIPCVETACSSTNPTGTCPNAGEACLYGACVSSCSPNPCTQELNKTVCSVANGAPQCQCAAGFTQAADGRCVQVAAPCSGGMSCGNGYCADEASTGFVCGVDADCGAGQTCSAALPSGTCRGCSATSPCPNGLDCLAGYCLKPCSAPTDCHPQMTCRTSGYCGRKVCSSQADCAAPYVCVAGTDGGSCQRPVCE